MTTTATAGAAARNLTLVPAPVQPLLPCVKAEKFHQPFFKRAANVRTGCPDAKGVLLVLAMYCEVYVDGFTGRCWPSRDTVRHLAEQGQHKFRRAWNRCIEVGAIKVDINREISYLTLYNGECEETRWSLA